jgi:hypothetical protein
VYRLGWVAGPALKNTTGAELEAIIAGGQVAGTKQAGLVKRESLNPTGRPRRV